jgi:hypothetical protein
MTLLLFFELKMFAALFGHCRSFTFRKYYLKPTDIHYTVLFGIEPQFALRVHLARLPFLQRQHRQALEDYKQLARSGFS